MQYELWQTEWCPASRRVRQRLTELGIDFVARQVPVEQADRVLLRERTGATTIPVLVSAGNDVIVGEDAIVAFLASHEHVPPSANDHQAKAEKARRRFLQEECECPPQPVTR